VLFFAKHAALRRKSNVPETYKNEVYNKLYALSDLLSEIESLKEDPKYAGLLSYYDTSSGVNQIVTKLPYNIQSK
jgi:hypothetical protein